MPKRNRLDTGALGSLVVVALAVMIGLWAGTYYHSPDSDYAYREAQYDSAVPDLSGLAQETGGAASYEAICQSPKNREYADLCQQWRSAEQASKAASYGSVQVILTVIGLFGLSVTAWLAYNANHISRENTATETRAYFSHGFGWRWFRRLDGDGYNLGVSVHWTNSGSTPAHNCETFITFDVVPRERATRGDPLFDRRGRQEGPNIPRPHIAPSSGITTLEYPLGTETLRRILPPNMLQPSAEVLMLYASVRYDDTFGEHHFISICYHVNITGLPVNQDNPNENGGPPVGFNTYYRHNEYDPED